MSESRRPRRRSRVLLPLLASVAALAVLFGAVFPTRAVLAQRSDIATAERELAELEAENAELEARIEALGTDDEIERIAREQYNLVFPGEEAYALLPPPPAPSPPWATLAALADLLGTHGTHGTDGTDG